MVFMDLALDEVKETNSNPKDPKELTPNKSADLNTVLCPFCGTQTQLIYSFQEKSCKYCGYIFEDFKYIEKTAKNVTQYCSANSVDYDCILSTNTRTLTKRSKQNKQHEQNLKKTLQKGRRSSTYGRTKLKGLVELERMCRLLDLPLEIAKQVKEQFSLYNRRGLLRNRNIFSVIAGLITITANKVKLPLSLVEILKDAGITKKKFNTDYFYLYHLGLAAAPTCTESPAHLKKYISFLKDWPGKNKCILEINKLAKLLKINQLTGREGIVLSGTLVYIISKCLEYPQPQQLLKNIVINRLTLKNCWKDLFKKIKNNETKKILNGYQKLLLKKKINKAT